MADREIVLWLEEWWYDALSHHLKNETLEEHLENVLDELCDQLPKQDYERISREIQEQARVEREAAEAARTYAAYHVMENGKEYYFKTSPGEVLLSAAQKLRSYLTAKDTAGNEFVSLFLQGRPISPVEYQQMMKLRMENTGKVVGVFDVDFDKREFSAVHIMDGWKTWAMHNVSVAAYRAGQKQYRESEDRLQKLLEHLDGKEITSAGHLSARNFTFGDEIIEMAGKLNFYVQAEFDVDAAFGTHVLTDENDDWLNIYANYDMERNILCGTLELTLCKGDGSEEDLSYTLNAAEQEVLRRKMDAFCLDQTGTNLHDYSQQIREEQELSPQLQI